jgi:hypothetical protein
VSDRGRGFCGKGAGDFRSGAAGKLSSPFSQRVFRRGADVNK